MARTLVGPYEARLLTGYRSVADSVDLSEGAGEDGGLIWWLELNVRLALDQPTNEERQAAVHALVEDLFPRTIGTS